MTAAILSTDLPGLPSPRRGKVRDVYDLGDDLLVVATDRISAFDVVMANGIPDKGRLLNQLSAYWFRQLGHLAEHHVITVDDREIARRIGATLEELAGRSMLCHKTQPLAIECVARGFLAGSLYKEYRALGPGVHGLGLPHGLQLCDRLPEPIFTPATKAETGHDENLSEAEARELVGAAVYDEVRAKTLALFAAAARHAESVGLILADTKFEFGIRDGKVIWIDEALTPDSSRYWPADAWQPGANPPSFDKQFVRDYLESIKWDKTPPGPPLPDEVVARTRGKYIEAYERLTGERFA